MSERMSENLCPAGFEPAAYGLEIRCSIQLSYGHVLRMKSKDGEYEASIAEFLKNLKLSILTAPKGKKSPDSALSTYSHGKELCFSRAPD
jgi:hypothetical protein